MTRASYRAQTPAQTASLKKTAKAVKGMATSPKVKLPPVPRGKMRRI
jgi:hypothetical protein